LSAEVNDDQGDTINYEWITSFLGDGEFSPSNTGNTSSSPISVSYTLPSNCDVSPNTNIRVWDFDSLDYNECGPIVLTTAECPEPDFEMSVAPTSQSVVQDDLAVYTITYTALSGYNRDVSGVATCPDGISCTLSPVTITPTTTQTLNARVFLDTEVKNGHVLSVTGTGTVWKNPYCNPDARCNF